MKIRKKVILEMTWAYLGVILLFVDICLGGKCLNAFFSGLDWIGNLGGLI